MRILSITNIKTKGKITEICRLDDGSTRRVEKHSESMAEKKEIEETDFFRQKIEL